MPISVALSFETARLNLTRAAQEMPNGSVDLYNGARIALSCARTVERIKVLSEISSLLVHPGSLLRLFVEVSEPYSGGITYERELLVDTRDSRLARINRSVYVAETVIDFRQDLPFAESKWGISQAEIK